MMMLVDKMLLPRWLLPKDVDAKDFIIKDATLQMFLKCYSRNVLAQDDFYQTQFCHRCLLAQQIAAK